MDVAVDLYLAVPLLFTVLALVLASVFVRLRGGRGGGGGERATERPREPAAAEPAREGGSGGEAAAPEGPGPAPPAGSDDEEGRVPVEEVGAGEETKEAVSEQREAAAEPEQEPEPGPAAAESIPRQPEPREDAESKIPPLGASPGSGLEHTGQAEGGCGHEALSSQAEEEDLDSENEKLTVREPEDEDAAEEMFSFKYSPGKLRGNQYKSMMTKEELEEEQRIELTSDLTSL